MYEQGTRAYRYVKAARKNDGATLRYAQAGRMSYVPNREVMVQICRETDE